MRIVPERIGAVAGILVGFAIARALGLDLTAFAAGGALWLLIGWSLGVFDDRGK